MNTRATRPVRSVGALTGWSVEEAEQMLLLLETLRADIWAHYGEDIARQYHVDEGQSAIDDSQLMLELEEPPF